MNTGGSGELTLAFSLTALERLEDPHTAFAAAREWSKYVGVVSERPQHVAMTFTRNHDLPKHFLPRPGGEMEQTLKDVRSVSTEYEKTDRYVLVGTTAAERSAAEESGWEFVPLEEAATAAGWTVVPPPEDSDSDVRIERDDRDDWP